MTLSYFIHNIMSKYRRIIYLVIIRESIIDLQMQIIFFHSYNKTILKILIRNHSCNKYFALRVVLSTMPKHISKMQTLNKLMPKERRYKLTITIFQFYDKFYQKLLSRINYARLNFLSFISRL